MKTSASDGFSVVEVIVAAGVLAVAVAGLAPLFTVAARANIDARRATYAAVLAAQKLEELRSATYPEPSAGELTEYLDALGGVVGAMPSRASAYERRWTIRRLPGPFDAMVIAVIVSQPHTRLGAVRLTTIRAPLDGER